MKSTIERINPVQYRVSVEVTPNEVEKAFDLVFKKIQKKSHLQGFRPGKAPISVIRKLYGNNASYEVHEALVNQHLFDALKAETINPIASPVIDTTNVPEVGKSFNFSAVVDILPELEINDYKGVALELNLLEASESSLEKEFSNLRRQHGRAKPLSQTDVTAASGHLATIAHEVKKDGQNIPQMTVEGIEVLLGNQEIYTGLEQEIFGMKIGETKNTTIVMPKDYNDPSVAGSSLDVTLTLKDLKEFELPNMDIEFAKDLGFESAETLKEGVTKQVTKYYDKTNKQTIEMAILNKLIEKYQFEVPPAMVDQVIDAMIHEQFKDHKELSEALKNHEIRQQLKPQARRQTQDTLLLWHVYQKEKLEVTNDEINQELETYRLSNPSLSDPKLFKQLRTNLEPRVRESLIFSKALKFLTDNAQITPLKS